jgi:hypothetical protein
MRDWTVLALTVIIYYFSVTSGNIHVENFIISNNYQFANVTVSYWNIENGDPIFCFKFRYNYDIAKMQMNFKFSLANGPSDTNYQWEILKMTFEYEKFSKYIEFNPFIKTFGEGFWNSLGEMKNFPVKKVKFQLFQFDNSLSSSFI